MVEYYQGGIPSKKMASYKLTQREIDHKYQHGYDKLVEKILTVVKVTKTVSSKNETEHRILLETLFSKKKLLKKHQEELQMIRDIYRANMKEEKVLVEGKKDHREEITEVVSSLQGFYP
jgi:hypothetical protein